jgi:hypothetical protein
MVWKKEMPVWVLAGDIEELSFLFFTPPPSLPVPPPTPPPPDPVPEEQALLPVYEPDPEPEPEPPPVLLSLSFEDDYTDFSIGQRWGTFGLNFLIPGLGSFAVMRDISGGFIHLGLTLAAYGAGAGGTIMILDNRDVGYGIIAAGATLYLASLIQNIVRSSTYHRPRPKLSLMDLDAWNIALVPGKNGIESAALSYTIRY